jgi:hypothetical protein
MCINMEEDLCSIVSRTTHQLWYLSITFLIEYTSHNFTASQLHASIRLGIANRTYPFATVGLLAQAANGHKHPQFPFTRRKSPFWRKKAQNPHRQRNGCRIRCCSLSLIRS